MPDAALERHYFARGLFHFVISPAAEDIVVFDVFAAP